VLRAFPEDVRRELGKAIYDLQLGHTLSMPLSRPMPSIGRGVAELRVRDSSGIYRAFYVVRMADAVLIFHAFAKKSQKTPKREITLGQRRLEEMSR
jgi:phage-related protein